MLDDLAQLPSSDEGAAFGQQPLKGAGHAFGDLTKVVYRLWADFSVDRRLVASGLAHRVDRVNQTLLLGSLKGHCLTGHEVRIRIENSRPEVQFEVRM